MGPALYSASSCISQSESAGIAQVREMELSLMCWNKFSSVIFPVCPSSLPKGISKHQGCSLLQLCLAVRMGFPTGSGLQAELSFWEKQRCFNFRETLALDAQLDPVQRDDPALPGKRKSINVSLILGRDMHSNSGSSPAAVPTLILGRSFFAKGKSIRNDCQNKAEFCLQEDEWCCCNPQSECYVKCQLK